MKYLTLLLFPILLVAVSLETLIEHTTSKHSSLESIQQRVYAMDDTIAISQNWSDPLFSLSLNGIYFNDISLRDNEALQHNSLQIQQKIPYFGKREAQANSLRAKQNILSLSKDTMKVQLVFAIKTSAYAIWQVQEKLKIIDTYISLAEQNIELSSAYARSDSSSHMGIMSAQMTLSDLRIKQSNLEALLHALYEKISYLSAMKVDTLSLELGINTHKHIQDYQEQRYNNTHYKTKQAQVHATALDIKVQELEHYPDPIIKTGYYHRNALDDYANISVSFSLPLYGTQKRSIARAKKLALASQSNLTTYDTLLRSEIVQTHVEIEDAFHVYNIIHTQSMPQIEHMFALSSSSIKNGNELFVYFNLLERKLALEDKSIAVITRYNKLLAKLEAKIGAIQ